MKFYVSGGIGIAFLDVDTDAVIFGQKTPVPLGSGAGRALALQAGAGVSYDLGGGTEVFLGARYFYTDDFDIGGGLDVDGFNNVSVGGGLRIKF